MYFKSRKQAGKLLAKQLAESFAGKDCSVVALNEGGVLVGMQIAEELECVLAMLLVDPIHLPGEIDAIGSISEDGAFAYNTMYSPGEIEEMSADYRGYIEEKKQEHLSQLHRLTGSGQSIDTDELEATHVILVADGFRTAQALDIALEILKPVNMKSLSAAAPVVTPEATDRLRVLCDRVFCLHITNNYLNTDHYYEDEAAPDRQEVLKVVKEFASSWEDDEPEVSRD